jgi:hypothetical protein
MSRFSFRVWKNKYIETDDFCLDKDGDLWNGGEPVAGAIIEQSTGLFDVDGKEIYEGDIVIDSDKCIAKVEWNESAGNWTFDFQDGCDYSWGDFDTPKVIGNVHEEAK